MKLRVPGRGARHDRQKGKSARHRKRGLGLVEDVEAMPAEAVGGQGEEPTPVRLAQEPAAAVDLADVLRVEATGDVEEALCAQ
jgi:hypothetical protein